MTSFARWFRLSMISSAVVVMALFAAACDTEGGDDGLNNQTPDTNEPTPQPFDDSPGFDVTPSPDDGAPGLDATPTPTEAAPGLTEGTPSPEGVGPGLETTPSPGSDSPGLTP